MSRIEVALLIGGISIGMLGTVFVSWTAEVIQERDRYRAELRRREPDA